MPKMTKIPNTMKRSPATLLTSLIDTLPDIRSPANVAMMFNIRNPIIAPMKTITGYIDCTTNASIASWLLSPNSENKTNDTMLRNELGVSQVSTSSLLLRANV